MPDGSGTAVTLAPPMPPSDADGAELLTPPALSKLPLDAEARAVLVRMADDAQVQIDRLHAEEHDVKYYR